MSGPEGNGKPAGCSKTNGLNMVQQVEDPIPTRPNFQMQQMPMQSMQKQPVQQQPMQAVQMQHQPKQPLQQQQPKPPAVQPSLQQQPKPAPAVQPQQPKQYLQAAPVRQQSPTGQATRTDWSQPVPLPLHRGASIRVGHLMFVPFEGKPTGS